MKECVICGTEFQPVRYTDKTCGHECQIEHRRNLNRERARRHYKPRPLPPDIACAACGVMVPDSRNRARKYCETCRANQDDRRVRSRQVGNARFCYKCGVRVPEAIGKNGRTVCGGCRSESRDPELARAKERRRTLRKYGITQDDFDKMLQDQDGLCFICQSDDPGPRGWNIDHCHQTNQVRALLCNHCNTALGLVKEDTTILRAMLEFVEEWEKVKI